MFPAYRLSSKNIHSENMRDIAFKKAKGHGGTVNRMSVHGEAAVQRVLQKRCYEKFRRIYKKTSVPESLFQCFLVNFVEFVGTPFLKNSTRQLLLIIAVSIVAKGHCTKNEVFHY